MRSNYLIAPLVLLPFWVCSQPALSNGTMLFTQNPASKYTIEKTYSNQDKKLKNPQTYTRTIDYPTQIIRMSNQLEEGKFTCDEVNNVIEEKILDHLSNPNLIYNTHINCNYDPETNYAKSFIINSYFDPINDEAVNYLNSYLAKYNGSDLLGTQLKIESAKGLVVSLSIAAGMKKNPDNPPFIVYKQDRSNFYFKSNYDLNKDMFTDIYQNFYSNDSEKILPFLEKWVFTYAGTIYKPVLRDSNYVELLPERIFLMGDGNELFVSGLKYYFAHNCNKYENHRCLKVNA